MSLPLDPYKSSAISSEKGSRLRYFTSTLLQKFSLLSLSHDSFPSVTDLSIGGFLREKNPASLLTLVYCPQSLWKSAPVSSKGPLVREVPSEEPAETKFLRNALLIPGEETIISAY